MLLRHSARIIICDYLLKVNLEPGSVYTHSTNAIFVNSFSLAFNCIIIKVTK